MTSDPVHTCLTPQFKDAANGGDASCIDLLARFPMQPPPLCDGCSAWMGRAMNAYAGREIFRFRA